MSNRHPTAGFTDVPENDVELPAGFDREKAKIFTPLQVGPFLLNHRIVHSALGRSRSAHGIESPHAAEYFRQRTTPGSLIISQATSVSLECIPWPWSVALHTPTQIQALSRTIAAVHEKGGIWFQQMFHPGRTTSPSLVKRAWEKAGHLEPPKYGYQPVSSSDVGESGINTHSGEPFGQPRPLTLEEIKELRGAYKSTAEKAVLAGADGIEVLAGNGFLLDQFLHDNINHRTDQYGGSIENRARLILEIIDDIAEVVGHDRIGIRISPFSNFHETDGSQPLDQIEYLCKGLVRRNIAYLNVGEPRVSRNLDIQENLHRLLKKGIPPEDISLRRFRILTTGKKTKLFGNGGYTLNSGLLTVERDLADGVVYGRRFISNPDLVERVRRGYPMSPYDRSTFYTHGYNGFLTYTNYTGNSNATNGITNGVTNAITNGITNGATNGTVAKSSTLPKVAVIGAGVSGLVTVAAFERLGGFDVQVFERKSVPGGSWVYDEVSTTVPLFPAPTPESINPPVPRPEVLPTTAPRLKQQRFTSSPLYKNLYANIPAIVMSGGSSLELPLPEGLYLTGDEIGKVVTEKAKRYNITYNSTVEDVVKTNKGLRLTLRREQEQDYWYEEDFDFLVVATGHNSVPHVPDIPGLNTWKGELLHTVTYRDPKIFLNKTILIVGANESAIDLSIHSLPYATKVYVSQRRPHPRHPTVFNREGVTVVSTINHLTENEVHLDDGTILDVDTIVFATGYFYTYPFLNKVRPPTDGKRVPGLYQHIFDMYNPNIAFIGVANATLSWLAWEKAAFLVALLWAGKIHLPGIEEQKKWENSRLHLGRHFHILKTPAERVIYFEDLNELAAEYLATDALDDELLRSYPYEWMLALVEGHRVKANFYGIKEPTSNHTEGTETEKADVANA